MFEISDEEYAARIRRINEAERLKRVERIEAEHTSYKEALQYISDRGMSLLVKEALSATSKKSNRMEAKMDFKYELGLKAESNITGFGGMIISRAEHLHGCNRYWLEPKVDKDGKHQEGRWFDEGELTILPDEKKERKNNDRGGFSSKVK